MSSDSSRTSVLALFARGDDPYAGADLGVARRIGVLLWTTRACFALALLPLAAPTEAIGAAGWPLAVLAGAGFAAAAAWLAGRTSGVTFDRMLAVEYAGLAQIALLTWLAGGHETPYAALFVLALSGAAMHPPRRALLFLAALAAAASLPLAYDGFGSDAATEIGVSLVLWCVLALAVTALIAHVRGERLRLRSGEAHARELALADAVTGLGNRRAFDQALQAEGARTRRAGSQLSVLLADLDHLKQINDELGHLEGDRCLRQVADTLRETVRGADRPFRWGGDEFAVLLPDTGLVEARLICERLNEHVRERCTTSSGDPLEVSCGVAELTEEEDGSDVLDTADFDLLLQKRERNQRETSPRRG